MPAIEEAVELEQILQRLKKNAEGAIFSISEEDRDRCLACAANMTQGEIDTVVDAVFIAGETSVLTGVSTRQDASVFFKSALPPKPGG